MICFSCRWAFTRLNFSWYNNGMGGTYLSQWRIQTFGWEGEWGRSQKSFLALPASVWSRDKGMGGGGAPLDPPLYLAHIWEYLGIWTYDLLHFRRMLLPLSYWRPWRSIVSLGVMTKELHHAVKQQHVNCLSASHSHINDQWQCARIAH